MSINGTTFDIFITHAWRFHSHWNETVQSLDSVPALKWRNFSVPWYDPALDPNTPFGAEKVGQTLLTQILPSQVVLFLCDVYFTKSARKWFDLEARIAAENDIPIVGVLAEEGTDLGLLPDDLTFSAMANYEPKRLFEALRSVCDWKAAGASTNEVD